MLLSIINKLFYLNLPSCQLTPLLCHHPYVPRILFPPPPPLLLRSSPLPLYPYHGDRWLPGSEVWLTFSAACILKCIDEGSPAGRDIRHIQEWTTYARTYMMTTLLKGCFRKKIQQSTTASQYDLLQRKILSIVRGDRNNFSGSPCTIFPRSRVFPWNA